MSVVHSTHVEDSCPTNPKQQAGPAAWPRSSPRISLHGYLCIYLETMCIHVDLSSEYSMSVHRKVR